jgi:hypothetical protein
MNEYIVNYPTFTKKIVYYFPPKHHGGIGDYIKYFMFTLQLCIQHNIQLYYQVTHSDLEKFLKLKYPMMYIQSDIMKEKRFIRKEEIDHLPDHIYHIIQPHILYDMFEDDSLRNIQDVFYFSNDVLLNSYKLYSESEKYISIHLRLGDKFLETEQQLIQCYEDTRKYNEDVLYATIEENKDNNILFFCDNNQYKLKIKNKYKHVYITPSTIGHTAYYNTSEQQTLDAVTEFYLISKSIKIYAVSKSGFSIIASCFKHIPLIKLY